ncbi:MAG: hypothetical protein HY902_02545 [Deltaproteobacteria bacterium]|nr:hypothetical protein [Deltaproteobacteria bacterium]
MIRLALIVATAAALSACGGAGATTRWLPAPPPTAESASASRDTPAFELAYGPRSQASLGARLPIVQRGRRDRFAAFGVHALGAFENASDFIALPLEVLRAVYGMDGRWLWRRGPDTWALGLGWGREQARTLGEAVLPDRPRPSDIAFGGGGTWLATLAEWQHRTPRWQSTVMLETRWHLAGLAARLPWTGPVADVLGGMAGDGLAWAQSCGVVLRWRPGATWQPLVSVHGDLQVPVDEFARTGWFARALLAASRPSQLGETMPFISLDAGNGKGYLINRREIRLSLGVRHAFF